MYSLDVLWYSKESQVPEAKLAAPSPGEFQKGDMCQAQQQVTPDCLERLLRVTLEAFSLHQLQQQVLQVSTPSKPSLSLLCQPSGHGTSAKCAPYSNPCPL